MINLRFLYPCYGVHPGWRGNGIANFILDHLISLTSKTVILETSIHNPALNLYFGKGFRIDSRVDERLFLSRPSMLAIMQPYFLPAPSYFQLIKSVDKFIFYDDVNFRKKGWINRNYIRLNGKKHLFSVPLRSQSQNKLICEIDLAWSDHWKRSFLATVKQCYSAAPYFAVVTDLLSDLLSKDFCTIADLAIASIQSISSYLELTTVFARSSEISPSTRCEKREERLIAITKQLSYSAYTNAAGGRNLYSDEQFTPHQIGLYFVDTKLSGYLQLETPFTPGLSIIDLIMFNSPSDCKFLLSKYSVG